MNTKHELLKHKSYQGSVEYSLNDGVLFGKILFIRDVITYEADTVIELKQAFVESVEDYLSECKEMGVDPDQPFTGTFQVRVGQIRHKALAIEQRQSGHSINNLVCQAIDHYFKSAENGKQISEIHDIVSRFRFKTQSKSNWTMSSDSKAKISNHITH